MRTLVLIKPDAVEKEVWLEIIKIYERHGLTIADTKIFAPLPLSVATDLYREHEGKFFYEGLVEFMTNGVTIALCVTGPNAVERIRGINGATDPAKAERGTIRRIHGTDGCRNAVHGSAKAEDAERELELVFGARKSISIGAANRSFERNYLRNEAPNEMDDDPIHPEL